MADKKQNLLRKIPSVDALLQEKAVAALLKKHPRKIVVETIRTCIAGLRQTILDSPRRTAEGPQPGAANPNADKLRELLLADIAAQLGQLTRPFYRRVINATGIILHTGLGRAPLAAEAMEQLTGELGGYSLLQVDIEQGRRSSRDQRIEKLLQILTGAEAATVVNNNAAATTIVLNTIARDREVIVSRGQLVEIGGSFRLPEIMKLGGARLVEVGTTNKTHPQDYINAITENSAAILRVHPSNYKIEGFTSEVPLDELTDIAHSHNLVMFDDVGAGALIDFSRYGFEPEPTLIDSIKAGADVVTASGDKLIGASQAGIILGKQGLIEAVRKNPFARIIRVDKLTLAVLEATLKLFLDQTEAISRVPTLRLMLRDKHSIELAGKRIAEKLVARSGQGHGQSNAEITIIDGFSQTGSGSLPQQNLNTRLVCIKPLRMSAQTLGEKLRASDVPVFTRLHRDCILIDPRTLLDKSEEKTVVEELLEILGNHT